MLIERKKKILVFFIVWTYYKIFVTRTLYNWLQILVSFFLLDLGGHPVAAHPLTCILLFLLITFY